MKNLFDRKSVINFHHSKLDYFTQIDACLLIGEAKLNRFWAKSRSKSSVAITTKLGKAELVPRIRDGVNQTDRNDSRVLRERDQQFN